MKFSFVSAFLMCIAFFGDDTILKNTIKALRDDLLSVVLKCEMLTRVDCMNAPPGCW